MHRLSYHAIKRAVTRFESCQIFSQRYYLRPQSSQRIDIFSYSSMASPSITPHTSPEFTGPKYGWHECVESLERYGPGGYHPVHLGDKFSNGRYEVIHKLGYGGYSTVWLCKDLQQQRYVSVKIAVSELPDEEHSEMYEVDVYHALRNGDEKHPGKRFVVSFLDDFVHQGPNGSHQCFVFPVAMNNVASAKNASIDNSRMFPPQIARSIAMQSLLGLSYIHACGVVHTGTVP